MPNHCQNILRIEGDFNHRQEFVDRNKGFEWGDTEKEGEYKDLSFHAQVPMPKKHIVSHAKNSSNSDWYSWANKNWGTKWDTYEVASVHDKNYTYYTFDTAWSPPAAWLKKVSRKFPHLKFNVEWAEEGGEGGAFMVHKGVMHNYRQFNDEEWKEHMGYEEEE